MTAVQIVEALGGRGDMACCPVPGHGKGNGDNKPSLHVTQDGDKVLVHCKAGCSQDEVIEALRGRGLWPKTNGGPVRKWRRNLPWPSLAKCRPQFPPDTPYETVDWTHATGEIEPQRVYRHGGDKWTPFRVGSKTGDLVFLTDGPADQAIILTEGAKCARHATEKTGRQVLAFVGASAKPSAAMLEAAKGRNVIAWPDNDDPGAALMERAAAAAYGAGALDVVTVNPASLGITGDGEAADDWDGAGGFEAVRAASVRVDRPAVELDPCDNEHTLGVEFAREQGDLLRYDADGQTWWRFKQGHGWRREEHHEVIEAVQRFGRERWVAVTRDGDLKPSPKTGAAKRTALGAMPAIMTRGQTRADQWDSSPALLGVPGGRVLDLETGEVGDMTDQLLVRRTLQVEPATRDEYEASEFRQVVEHVVPDDQEREYLQRRLGAALACKGEDAAIILFGPPRSGKGSLVAAVSAAFGSYCVSVPTEALLASRDDRHPEWLARLRGARLTLADELGDRALNAHAIKQVTGTIVTAREMRGTSFEFKTTAPVLATSNHRPRLSVPDGGAESRLRPIQGGPTVGKGDRDDGLRDRMESLAEVAACLRWLLDGLDKYTEGGCPVPPSLTDRTQGISAATPLAEFLDTIEDGEIFTATELHRRYQTFMSDAGMKAWLGRNQLADKVRDLGWYEARDERDRRALQAPVKSAGENPPDLLGRGTSGSFVHIASNARETPREVHVESQWSESAESAGSAAGPKTPPPVEHDPRVPSAPGTDILPRKQPHVDHVGPLGSAFAAPPQLAPHVGEAMAALLGSPVRITKHMTGAMWRALRES